MKLHHLELYKTLHNSKLIHAFAKKASINCFSKHSTSLFRTLVSNKRKNRETKYFHFTKNTERRLKNIPVEKMSGEKLIELRKRSGDSGICYFDNGLHFLFTINRDGIYLLASDKYKMSKIVSGGDNELDFMVMRMNLGFLYSNFTSPKINFHCGNELDIIINPESSALLQDNKSRKIALRIFNELNERNLHCNTEGFEAMPENSLTSNYYKDWLDLFNKLKLCFQGFLFIYFAKIYDKTFISECNYDDPKFAKLRGKKVLNNKVIQVNTDYDENVTTINPFSVTGHFRNQPCGVERKDRKLIYIDEFMKTGYTRVATKIKENMNVAEKL